MKKNNHNELPLVYSCSGCSSIAQLANQVAVQLDREQVAEMSCIAGVGGGVKSLVKKSTVWTKNNCIGWLSTAMCETLFGTASA